MRHIFDTINATWENTYGRFLILGASFGFVPFYLLTEAHAALVG